MIKIVINKLSDYRDDEYVYTAMGKVSYSATPHNQHDFDTLVRGSKDCLIVTSAGYVNFDGYGTIETYGDVIVDTDNSSFAEVYCRGIDLVFVREGDRWLADGSSEASDLMYAVFKDAIDTMLEKKWTAKELSKKLANVFESYKHFDAFLKENL
jgi:hypothetical protein